MPDLSFAAIDIGSNAIRLLVSHVHQAPDGIAFKKMALVRVPLRLGEDAFVKGKLSKAKIEKFEHTLHAFQHLMAVHDVVDFRACATSAMRDASNGPAVVKQLKEKTGVEIEIISGKREAEIIYATQIQHYIRVNRSYLYVDVGGGSTEVTLFMGRKSTATRSFNIGTIRLLNNQVAADQWSELRSWIKKTVHDTGMDVDVIGSGGNINKTFKMLRKEEGQPIKRKELENFHEFLNSYTVEERVRWLNLRPDRADVIPHAVSIFVHIMRAAKSKRIYVPKFGVADGIVKELYDQYRIDHNLPGAAVISSSNGKPSELNP